MSEEEIIELEIRLRQNSKKWYSLIYITLLFFIGFLKGND